MGEEEGFGVGGAFGVGLEVGTPAACEGVEEGFGYDFCEGVRGGFWAFLLDGHAGGEGADF